MNKPSLRLLTFVGALFVCAVVLINHKGFLLYAVQPEVLSKLNHLLILKNIVLVPLVGFIFALSFYGFGRRLLSLLGGDTIGAEYRALFSFSLGIGLFNFIVFLISIAGLLYPSTTILLIAAGIFLAAGKMDFPPALSFPRIDLFLLPAGIGIAYILAEALAPPTSWDALAYQVALPKLYAEHHGLFLVPSMLLQQCTSGMEMLSASGLSLGFETLPPLFSFFTLLLTLSALYVFARKNISATGAAICFSLFAIMPLTLRIGGAVNNDFSVCLFSLLAFICFFEYAADKKSSWLYLLSAFSGLAVAAKMTGFITVSWLALCLLYLAWRDKERHSPRTLAAMAVIFLALGSAGYARNYLWTGNPAFPYFSGVFPGSDPGALAVFKKCRLEIQMTEGVPATLWNFARLPWFLISAPERFQHQPQYLIISILGMLALQLTRFRRRVSFSDAVMVSFILYFFVIWFFSSRQLWRFALVVLPLIIFLVGKWWEGITSRPAKIAAACLLAVNIIPLLRWNVNNTLFGVFSLPSLSSPALSPRDNYLSRTLNFYDVYDFSNKNLPPDAGILLFREVRGYHLDRRYVWGDPLNQSVIDYSRFADADALYRHLISLKITHVIVNDAIYLPSPYYYDAHTMAIMDTLLSRHGRAIYERNRTALYQLT